MRHSKIGSPMTLWVEMRRTRIEHMLSAYHPIATTERTFRIGRFVPKAAVPRHLRRDPTINLAADQGTAPASA